MKRLSKVGQRFLQVLLLSSVVYVPYAKAEETVKSSDVHVTATRIEKELQEVPISVTVMTGEDIKKSSARSVGELLQDVPGVAIQSDGSQGLKRVSIRGENAFRTLILIDGQKISEHKSMSGSPILIDPSRIERVEVIKGPASVLYGSDAIGGVINIITKKGGKKALQGDFFVEYNGASKGASEGLSLYGAKNGWEYRVSASYSDHGNIRTPIGEFDNTGFRQKDFSGFLSYDVNENLTVGGAIDYFKGSFNSTSMDMALDPNANFFVNVPLWDRQKYSAFIELKDITEYLARLRFDVYYQENEKDMRNYVNPNPIVVVDNLANNVIKSTGFSLQADWQVGENNYLITGYDINRDALDSTGSSKQRVAMGPMVMKDTLTQKFYDGTQLNQSVFASMETYLPYDFTLSYGVRWTHVKTELTKGYEHETGKALSFSGGRPTLQSVDNYYNAYLGSDTNSRPVFNVGLVWAGIDNLALRASWAQGFRVPNLTEKYIGSEMGGGVLIGNPNLDPETSNNFEIGARWNDGKMNIDVAVFYADADDYIASVLTNKTENAYSFKNVAKAKTYGSELAFSRDFATSIGTFTPYTTVTFMRRQYDDGEGFSTYNTATPKWVGRYGVRMVRAINENVDFNADVYARSQSETVYSSSNGENDYYIAGFTTANIAVGFDFGKDKKYSIIAEVLNLFDKEYMYTTALPEPGVHANLKFNMSF